MFELEGKYLEIQVRFEKVLLKRMKKDTAYTTMDIVYLLNRKTDPPTLPLSALLKKLFRATLNEKLNHIKKGNLHFWANGKLVLKK